MTICSGWAIFVNLTCLFRCFVILIGILVNQLNEINNLATLFYFNNILNLSRYADNDTFTACYITCKSGMLYSNPVQGCPPRGVMVKAMDCGIVVREFVLQSRYYVYFQANTLGKGMNPIFVAASHQTQLDTRSKARRPIKVGIKGRGGLERAETRTLLVGAAHRLT